MRLFPSRLTSFLLLSYAALSVVPFSPLLLGHAPANPVWIGCVEVIAWMLVWATFRHPVLFHWLLLPAFLAFPMELYLQLHFNQGLSPHHLGIIFETTPREALEFIGNRIWMVLAVLIGTVTWWAIGWYAAWRDGSLTLSGKGCGVAILVIALMLGFLNTPASGRPTSTATASTLSGAHNALGVPSIPWISTLFDEQSFALSWPFGVFARGWEFWKERVYLGKLGDESRQFEFGAHQDNAGDLPQVVVVVIGESARFDRWSLNGYTRKTNPLLEKENNLVTLSDVVTPVSATRLSVPVLLSRKPAQQSLKAGFNEKSFLSAFKEAGFKTYWLSNQMSFGEFDTPVSVFAKEADVTRFMNLGGFRSDSSYDSALLAPFRKALEDPGEKKLIVLHTLGSHWNYSHRYPEEFDKWQPSLFGVTDPAYSDAKLKLQLNNSYDNSVLYTDWILFQIITELKGLQGITGMMYVADHGEALYDGTCKLALHGHNTQYDFHIPAMVWYSDMYRATHPTQILQLQKNRHAKLTTENMFHSLLDMANIRYDDERLEGSFMSPKFKPHTRYVDSYGWTDYDNSTFRGDCREVIDKGKPLPRSD